MLENFPDFQEPELWKNQYQIALNHIEDDLRIRSYSSIMDEYRLLKFDSGRNDQDIHNLGSISMFTRLEENVVENLPPVLQNSLSTPPLIENASVF